MQKQYEKQISAFTRPPLRRKRRGAEKEKTEERGRKKNEIW